MTGKATTSSSLPKLPVVKTTGLGTVGLALIRAQEKK